MPTPWPGYQIAMTTENLAAVYLQASTMLTALGVNRQQTCAAVQAGLAQFTESGFLSLGQDELLMAQLPEDALPALHPAIIEHPLNGRQRRLLRLATRPLQALAEQINATKALPLFLAGPEKWPEHRTQIKDRFIAQLQQQTQVPLDLQNSYVFPQGRAGGFYAIQSAMHFFAQSDHTQVLVGGLDSYCDASLLAQLDQQQRLRYPGIMDGFIPGEGAVFLLLGKQPLTADDPCLQVPGIGEEPGHRYSEHTYLGEGLSQAIAGALKPVAPGSVQSIFSSMNGESFFAREWGISQLRHQTHFVEDLQIFHPADSVGDTGAASGPLMLGLAANLLQQGVIQGHSLLYGTSDFSPRGALCMALQAT